MLEAGARPRQSQKLKAQTRNAAGLTKSLSVSNFSPEQIDCILDDEDSQHYPCVNQVLLLTFCLVSTRAQGIPIFPSVLVLF